MSSTPAPYALPPEPPAEALAALDAAAGVLDGLARRGAVLTVAMDAEGAAVRIGLDDGSGSRRLTPTQLLDLLAGG